MLLVFLMFSAGATPIPPQSAEASVQLSESTLEKAVKSALLAYFSKDYKAMERWAARPEDAKQLIAAMKQSPSQGVHPLVSLIPEVHLQPASDKLLYWSSTAELTTATIQDAEVRRHSFTAISRLGMFTIDILATKDGLKADYSTFLSPQPDPTNPANAVRVYMFYMLQGQVDKAQEVAESSAVLTTFFTGELLPGADRVHLVGVIGELSALEVHPKEVFQIGGKNWSATPDETAVIIQIAGGKPALIKVKRVNGSWRVQPFEAVGWLNQ